MQTHAKRKLLPKSASPCVYLEVQFFFRVWIFFEHSKLWFQKYDRSNLTINRRYDPLFDIMT